jgi:hypothetical protein
LIIVNEQDKANVIAKITKLKLAEPWEITAKPYKHNRTQAQNKYIWGVVYVHIKRHIFDTLGTTFAVEEIHEWCKDKFIDGIPKMVIDRLVMVKSTSDMNTTEFCDYVGRIQHHFAEQDLYIPDPVKI